MNPVVSIVKCPDYSGETVRSSIKKAVDLIGGMEKFIFDGQRVLIKPNLCLPEPPEKSITTHPEIVRQTVNLCLERMTDVTVGDNPVGVLDISRLDYIWKKTGMKLLSEEMCFKQSFLLYNLLRYTSVINGKEQEYYISKDLFDFDCIINLPKFKTHTLMTFTGAVKNLFGVLPGNSKRMLHCSLPAHEHFAKLLLDLHRIVQPRLNIMDAVTVLEGDGPGSGGKNRKIGLIMASDNGIALDIVASSLMNIHPGDVPTNNVAIRDGYFQHGYFDITVVGEDMDKCRINDFLLPSTHLYNQNIIRKLFSIAKTSIHIDQQACSRCGLCQVSCPIGAIRSQNNRINVVNEECISCMLCHEICPCAAIQIERPDFYRQLTSLKKEKNAR